MQPLQSSAAPIGNPANAQTAAASNDSGVMLRWRTSTRLTTAQSNEQPRSTSSPVGVVIASSPAASALESATSHSRFAASDVQTASASARPVDASGQYVFGCHPLRSAAAVRADSSASATFTPRGSATVTARPSTSRISDTAVRPLPTNRAAYNRLQPTAFSSPLKPRRATSIPACHQAFRQCCHQAMTNWGNLSYLHAPPTEAALIEPNTFGQPGDEPAPQLNEPSDAQPMPLPGVDELKSNDLRMQDEQDPFPRRRPGELNSPSDRAGTRTIARPT